MITPVFSAFLGLREESPLGRSPDRLRLGVLAPSGGPCSSPRSWGTGGRGWDSASLRCVVLTRRKPKLLLLLSGELLLRLATRQLLALLFQLPPRFTRFEPDAGPRPFLHAPKYF